MRSAKHMSTESADIHFKHLERLIHERQQFEKSNVNPRVNTASHPTTIDYYDLQGKNLLHYAVEEGNLLRVKNLISRGAEINLKTLNYGNGTFLPIELALHHGHNEVAQYLFEQGARCTHVEAKLCKASSACREWFEQVIRDYISKSHYFNQFNEGIDLISRAIEIGDLSYLEQHSHMIEHSHLPLRVAAANGKRKIIQYLFDQTLPLEPSIPYTESALHDAIRYGHTDTAMDLLNKGANINWENSDKETALFIAIEIGDNEAIAMLLKKGAHLFKTDVHGNTILHKAALTGHLPLILPLIKESDLTSLKSLRNIYDQRYDETKNGIKISQHERVIPRISYYLHSQYRDRDLLSFGGYCYGLSKLAEYYSGKKRKTTFIARWI